MPKTTSSGKPKQSELPGTVQRSPAKAQRTFAKTHDQREPLGLAYWGGFLYRWTGANLFEYDTKVADSALPLASGAAAVHPGSPASPRAAMPPLVKVQAFPLSFPAAARGRPKNHGPGSPHVDRAGRPA